MAETIIGLGAEPVKKDSTKEIARLSKALAEKDSIIANAEKTVLANDEEISTLTKKIAELKEGIAEKDSIIANAEKTVSAKDEEISALTKKIAELEKGGSDNGTASKDSGGGAGKSKAK